MQLSILVKNSDSPASGQSLPIDQLQIVALNLLFPILPLEDDLLIGQLQFAWNL